MKVAIVHDWLTTYSGAESALECILELLPEADLFCLVDYLPVEDRGFIEGRKIKTSFIQKLPFSKSKYRGYLPFMPLAIEQFDLSGYDLVISSSHAIAKGVITGPNQIHISYVYSPIRYAWDLQHQYLKESNLQKGIKSLIVRLILHYIRIWDVRTANGVDYFVAISDYIKRRINKVYRRESKVIYPPVDTEYFTPGSCKKDYYLTASRMVPYKMISLIVEAFSKMQDKELIVIGDGPEMKKILNIARNCKNIRVLGRQSRDTLKTYLQEAKAFVFASEEDFGIAPLEAQSCGTPVICYAKGGALETVVNIDDEKPTGVYYFKQDIAELVKAIDLYEDNVDKFTVKNCRDNSLRFSKKIFISEFGSFMREMYLKNKN